MDLTWCTERTAAGNKCAMAMTDYETDKAWVKLLKKKDEVLEEGLKFIDELVSSGRRL